VLDRYILAKTRALVEDVTERMDDYDIAGACGSIQSYLDALTNWYIRRSRERFWSPGTDDRSGDDGRDAFDTLFTVLRTLVRVVAPLLPFVADEVHLGLNGDAEGTDGDSVHLRDWPDAASLPADPDLVADMDRIRDACSAALGLREDLRLRTRLPLQRLTLAGDGADRLLGLLDLLRDEVNVREVVLTDDASQVGDAVLRPDARTLGPRLGSDVQKVLAAARSGDWERIDDGRVLVAGHELGPGDFELALQPRPGTAAASLRHHDDVVELDVELTDDLVAEGRARDVVRLVQQARKDAGLQVTDRISLLLAAEAPVRGAVEEHGEWLRSQVLATDLVVVDVDDERVAGTEPAGETDGLPVWVSVLEVRPRAD
jgi:isoleucyl-tRNA synthetase